MLNSFHHEQHLFNANENNFSKKSKTKDHQGLLLCYGILAIALSLAGLITYAIVQVPSLRSLYGNYNLEDPYLNTLAYYSEIILIASWTGLGLLVNILLVLGIHKLKRWYLLHWLIYHVISAVALFVTSILVFVIQKNLYKLIGIVPLFVIGVILLIWMQVYKLFMELDSVENSSTDVPVLPLPPPPPPPPPPFLLNNPDNFHLPILGNGFGGTGPGSVTSEYEFYPVDPISRGLSRRMDCLQYRLQHHHYPDDENIENNTSLVN